MRRLDPELAARADAIREAGHEPIAVLDVDLTLLDNAPRNRAIWGDWLHGLGARWDGAASAAVRAQTMPIVFGVAENLSALGVTDPELVKEGFRFWLRAFFDGEYCRLDVPLPGALEAVEILRASDVTVAYLTARPAAMAPGSAARFRELGFPVGEPGTLLAMKPTPREDDGAFKAGALAWLGRIGRPILCADNEPGHVNAMHAAFEGARCVLVDTRHSGSAPSLDPGIQRVPSLLDAVTAL